MTAPTSERHDVVVLGGGLAGLTLALQLLRRRPGTRVLVVERERHPVDEAAHKVGEATVENSAHYFRTVLGLEEHLDTRQIRKMGLRFLPQTGPASVPLTERLEVGPRELLARKSYQLDRGRFENALGELVTEAGATFLSGWRVKGVELAEPGSGEPHRATIVERETQEERTVEGTWIVDAAGRQAILKRKLGLSEDVEHDCNAAWFRLSEHISMDDLIDEQVPPPSAEARAEWYARVPNRQRWRSTNHLMGPGYWLWLIPLASGSISVGLVADPRLVPFSEMRDFDTLLAWMERHEPEAYRAVARRRDSLQDFRRLKHYAHGCKQVFSSDRWAITGEAGVFLDPLYSPGSDYIALSNTYVVDLVTRDLAGEPIDEWARRYDTAYLNQFRAALVTWTGQYPLMGNPQVYALKAGWDTLAYFAVSNLLFLNDRTNDWEFMQTVRDLVGRARTLNATMQAHFRELHEEDGGRDVRDYVDLGTEAFVRLSEELLTPLGDDEIRARLERNVTWLEAVAAWIRDGAASAGGDAPPLPPAREVAASFVARAPDATAV